MAIEMRTATSQEMKSTIQSIIKMQKKMGFDENMEKLNWRLVRFVSNMGYRLMKPQQGVKCHKSKINRIKVDICEPMNKESEHIIMHIHGGGCVSGSARASRGYCSQLAKESSLTVISVEYALAPEHPYPAGLNDVYDCYCGILENYPNAKVSIIGESAGAYYCMALLVRCLSRGTKLPSSIVLNSPVAMLETGRDLSFGINPDTTTVTEGAIAPLQRMYAGKADVKNPEISCIYDKHADQYPPIFITCDAHETLRADAQMIYDISEKAGREVHLVIIDGTFHAACTTGYGTPETTQILKESCEFMKAHM